MVLSRISTYGQNSYNWANLADSQKRISDLHIQVITGKKAQHASGIARDANLLFNLENQVSRNQRYEASIDIAQRRLTEMETNTGSILKRVGEFRTTLLQLANDPNQEELDVASMAKDFYNEIAGYLNAEQEQRFLFSGGRTDTRPVKDFDTMIADMRSLLTDSDTVTFDSGISNFVPSGDVVGQPVAFLNSNALAEAGAVDPATGLPIREMQVIDFFTNDATFGSLARTVTGNGLPDDLTGQIVNELSGVGLPNAAGAGGASTTSVNPIDFKRLYYQGDDTALTVQVEDNRTVEYGVTAEARGFELVLAAATILGMDDASPPIDLYDNTLPGARVPAATTDAIDLDTRIEAALKLFEDAIKDTGIDNVASIRSEIGVADNQLKETEKRLANFNLFYEGSISEIENADVLEAVTLLDQNRLVLEQAFRSIGTLRNLSLANFIR